MANSLFSLHAYLKEGIWMFDDESRNIKEEPFVAGADIMFDIMSGREADPTIESCSIVFGATPIPDHDIHVTLFDEDGHDGHFYLVEKFKQFPDMKGFTFWLCPALLQFFEIAPTDIFVSLK
jgi:hypothetical protein